VQNGLASIRGGFLPGLESQHDQKYDTESFWSWIMTNFDGTEIGTFYM
jgi:hypothetical protein